jgi:hypothetical protein
MQEDDEDSENEEIEESDTIEIVDAQVEQNTVVEVVEQSGVVTGLSNSALLYCGVALFLGLVIILGIFMKKKSKSS